VSRKRGIAGATLPPADGATTLIAAGLKVSGRLGGNVDVIIGGALDGELSARRVAVAEGAEIDGSIRAHVVDIAGSVRGRVEAMTINVAETARIDAALYHHELNVERGAQIKGLKPWRPAPDMERRRDTWGVFPG
jgi:cytoskeletal protein CcmA (bactofilin family)